MPRVLLSLASFMVIVAGLRAAQSIVVPFVLSSFISILAVPPLIALRNRGFPASIALSIVLGTLLISGSLIITLLGTSIADFTVALPRYQERLDQLIFDFVTMLSGYGVDVSFQNLLQENINPSAIFQLAGKTLSQLGNLLSQSFLIFLTVSFMLAEATSLPEKIEAAFGTESRVASALDSFVVSLNQYVSIKTLVSVLTGLTVTGVLALFGIDSPILWGVLAFFLNYVPNLGSLLAAIPPMLLALVQYSVYSALGVGVAFVAINMVFGNILEPKLMGRGLGMSTLVVFLSLVFWGWVLGPIGMLLSVPLTMAVKIALESREETRWIAVLLSSTPLSFDVEPEQIKESQ